MRSGFSIVGIGASAGGLEALQSFVQSIPNDSGIAYVIVQHLAPDHPSIMDRLLGAHTKVPVRKIEDGATVEPDTVYVIPAGPFAEIEDGAFRLVQHEREEGLRTPIDRFLTSLSAYAGRRAVAVILSGTGSDGTTGVRAIKAEGGIAIVQERTSARFPGMPDSAAATGLVDFTLRPSDMPDRILEIIAHRRHLEDTGARDEIADEIEDRLDEVVGAIDGDGRHGFESYKPGTLVRRVLRRMTLLRQSSVDGYIARLRDDDEEGQRLAQDFLIGVTQFFRDPDSYVAIAEHVIEPLLDKGDGNLRVWVPGCSTGEELFSLAILLTEAMEARGVQRNCQMFGTDVDMDALRHARQGRYSEPSLTGVDDARRKRFFTRSNGHWQVKSELREMCVFAPHNLLQDPPFSRLDLISCRNVMIYLNADAQEALLPRFHYALKESRFLVLGPSESLGRSEKYFHVLDRSARIFRRDDTVSAGYTALKAWPSRERDRNRTRDDPKPGGDQLRQVGGAGIESRAEAAFLKRFAAPFAVVDRQGEITYLSEAMTRFARPGSGAPATTIDGLLSRDLRLPVHSALEEARQNGGTGEVRNVAAEGGETARLYDVSAAMLDDDDQALVVLTEVRRRDDSLPAPGDHSSEAAQALERDLMLTRKRLGTIQREYETAEQELRSTNEELLSMNEELQSSNEELETSREELQSINEELETINAELTENNRQLARANSDLQNLLQSTDIPTLFLDTHHAVKLFTPEAARLFGVRERDLGRSIHDLACKVSYPELRTDCEAVQNELQPVEREVRVEGTDETFQARVRPYRTVDDRLDGVVVTFLDVTARKRHERELEQNAQTLREQYAELETLYDTAPVGLNLLDRDLRYLRINDQLAAINGFPPEEHVGKRQADLIPDVHAEIVADQMRVFETGEPILGLTVQGETPAEPGRTREWIVDYYPVDAAGEVFAIGSCVREVTEHREMERELARRAARIAESQARLARLFDSAPAMIAMHEGPEHTYIYSNSLHDRAVGGRDLIGKPLREAMPELEGQGIFETFDEVFRSGRPVERSELRAALDLGEGLRKCFYRQILQPWFDGEGAVQGVMSFAYDITEEVRARDAIAAGRERLQKVQDSLTSFVGLLAPDGTLLEANAPALERGGLTRADVIGKPFWECPWWSFDKDVQARLADAVARAAAGKTVRYETPVRVADNGRALIDFQLVPNVAPDGTVTEIIPSGIDITEQRRAEERKDVLLAELQHRVKNILATVQSVMRFTARLSRTKEDLVAGLNSRLTAIARTHDNLTRAEWAGQSLRRLAETEMQPYVSALADRFRYVGPDVRLNAAQSLSMGLALHELATNAAKYGAFSGDEGWVEMEVEADAGGDLARLIWTERGGPEIASPGEAGFGSFLLRRVVCAEFGADVTLDFDPEGLRFILDVRGPDG